MSTLIPSDDELDDLPSWQREDAQEALISRLREIVRLQDELIKQLTDQPPCLN